MYPEVAFVDATVLYTRSTRDWLLHIRNASNRGMYVIATSLDVIVEALNWVRNDHPTRPGISTTQLMDGLRSTLDMVDEFDAGIPFPGTDEGDRHVHAAAVACGAGFLVTDDGGFARMSSDETPYEVITADEFFVLVDDSHPHVVAEATRNQLQYWAQKGEKAELVERLAAAGCPEFAKRVESHIGVQAGVLTRRQRRRTLNPGDY